MVTESISSVQLTNKPKGVEIVVKVYNKDPFAARSAAENIFDNLLTKYGEMKQIPV